MIRFATTAGFIQYAATTVLPAKTARLSASSVHFGNQGDQLDLSKPKTVAPIQPSQSSGIMHKLYGTPGKNLFWGVVWGAVGVSLSAIIPPVALGLIGMAAGHVVIAAMQAFLNLKNKPTEQTAKQKRDSGSAGGDGCTSYSDFSSPNCNHSNHHHGHSSSDNHHSESSWFGDGGGDGGGGDGGGD